MYHIKNDKRSRASAEEISKGLYQCLQHAPLSTITVSDLHRQTGISRATFYRLFDTPEDVLVYQLDSMVGQMAQYFEVHASITPIQAYEGIIYEGLKYPEMLEALVKNGRIDLLISYIEQYFRLYQENYASLPDSLGEEEKEYITTNICMSLVATLVTWVRRGKKESAQQVIQFVNQQWRMIARITLETLKENG